MEPAPVEPARAQRIALVDLLDRVLAEGVVITGDITLSVADIDLVTISLRALLASTSALAGPTGGGGDDRARPLPS
jgi:Gas vesicle protein